MTTMQERLPRELRDMVYEYMWLPDEHKKIDPIHKRRCCCPEPDTYEHYSLEEKYSDEDHTTDKETG